MNSPPVSVVAGCPADHEAGGREPQGVPAPLRQEADQAGKDELRPFRGP